MSSRQMHMDATFTYGYCKTEKIASSFNCIHVFSAFSQAIPFISKIHLWEDQRTIMTRIERSREIIVV